MQIQQLSIKPGMILCQMCVVLLTACAGKGTSRTVEERFSRTTDTLELLRRVEKRQGTLDGNTLRLVSREPHNSRYGLPVRVMQVTGKDFGGEFRIRLLNHAAWQDIEDGKRVFTECTWKVGYERDSVRRLQTFWYEKRNGVLLPVDSLVWREDTEF